MLVILLALFGAIIRIRLIFLLKNNYPELYTSIGKPKYLLNINIFVFRIKSEAKKKLNTEVRTLLNIFTVFYFLSFVLAFVVIALVMKLLTQ